MKAWGLTDIGNVRAQNQDAYRIESFADALLCVVCDGMGGAKAGNVASALACEVFTEEILRSYRSGCTQAQLEQLLRDSAALANTTVYEHAQLSEEFFGMGTTLVAALICGGYAHVLNIGDSRAYFLNSDGLRRVTTDHSLVELMVQRGELTAAEARTHPRKNYITRAVGTAKTVQPDVFFVPMCAGDCLLLCSDGLSNQLADEEILFEVIHGAHRDDCCGRLLQIAKKRGAPDNVTSVLAEV